MEIVSRAGWGATAPRGGPMPLPAREVWLHHSVTPVTVDPAADMRVIERVGVQRFGRFSYSWAVHPTGVVLEGAGVTIGAHTGGRNSTSFGIVLIGNYDDLSVTDPQMAATADLIRWLMATGKLLPGTYPTGGHRDLKATSCPGARAYPRIGELRRLVANPPEEDDMPWTQDDWDRMSRLVDGRLDAAREEIADAAAAKVLTRLNEDAFGDDAQGSPFRVEVLKLTRRGVNEALGAAPGDDARGLLDDRLVQLETKLDAALEPVEVPDVPPPV